VGTLGGMTDCRHKLVFCGEVLEGQHPAVVRKRLATLASYEAEHLDLLFSGRPVVIEEQADSATAADLQTLFKRAGARLHSTEMPKAVQPTLQLLPSGSPVLDEHERRQWQPREVDTSGLSMAELGVRLSPASAGPAMAPRVPQFDVAPLGEPLGNGPRYDELDQPTVTLRH
jgi:hypothetical protein